MSGGHNLIFKEPGLRKWADNFAFGVMIGRCVVQLHFVCLTLKISGVQKRFKQNIGTVFTPAGS
jgi:hypothetical protein